MSQKYSVRCPNCGDFATRSQFASKEQKFTSCLENLVLQTACSHCDYLMVTCSLNGHVIEAHSSSTSLMLKKDDNINSQISPLVTPPLFNRLSV